MLGLILTTSLFSLAQPSPSITVSCRPGAPVTREELLTDLDKNLREKWGLEPTFSRDPIRFPSLQDPPPRIRDSKQDQGDEVTVRAMLNRALSFPKVTGTMGLNSTPAQRAIDPRISQYYTIGTGLGFMARGSEKSTTLTESLEMPFGERIAFELSLPFEHASMSEARRQELGLPSRTATEVGDVAWAFRMHINKSSGVWYDPDLAVRAYTQSASGSDKNGLHYDAARYTVEFDVGETFYEAPSAQNSLQEVRGVFMGGLDVPQARDRQIDRFSYGIGTNFYFRNGWRIDAGLYGYEGYAEMDSQLNLYSTIFVPLTQKWNVAIDATCGLTEESPDYGVHVTFGFGAPTPFPR